MYVLGVGVAGGMAMRERLGEGSEQALRRPVISVRS
jgi:hypothetical protein